MNAYGRKGRERKRLYTNACGKERKKEQATNDYGKERKTKPQMMVANDFFFLNGCPNQASKRKNGCPNQASKQLTPNERNKTAETTSKTRKRWPTCKHKVEKTPPNHKSYRLLSATNEWTTTVKAIRAQSKNNCANDKQIGKPS